MRTHTAYRIPSAGARRRRRDTPVYYHVFWCISYDDNNFIILIHDVLRRSVGDVIAFVPRL